MTKRIEPDLFACLMKMPSGTRRDLLEFLGQTPVDVEHIVANAQIGTDAQPLRSSASGSEDAFS